MGVASYFYVTNESSYPNMQLSGTYKLAVGDEITVVVTGGHVYYDADANGESSKGRFDAAFSGHFIG